MARAIDHINGEPAAKSVSFDGTIYEDGATIPVLVTIEGADQFGPVDVSITLA